MSKRESINQEPLTIEELKTMAGLPVWCPEEEAYGIVMCDKIGQWAGIPFLHGVWYSDDDGVGVEFNHNIIGRKLKCFRVEDKKEIVMPLQNKEIGFGDQTLESYLRALDKTHNPDLAIQTAMGVTMVLRMIDAQNEPKQPAQPQINPMAALFGAMMQQAAQNQQEEGSEIESDDDE